MDRKARTMLKRDLETRFPLLLNQDVEALVRIIEAMVEARNARFA